MTTLDLRSRPFRDLRISLTDRCNLRCTYCMPRSVFGPSYPFLPTAALMTADDIELLVRGALLSGVRTVRLTGGEPLTRGDVVEIVRRCSSVGVPDLALTTNGVLLARHAQGLRAAGLDRLTVSVDSLDPEVFHALSDTKAQLDLVLAGIAAAADAGFAPIKLNCVVRRGVNENGILELVEFARLHGHLLRLIEFMDVGSTNGWQESEVVSGDEMVALIAARHPLEPVAAARLGEVATRYRYLDGGGEIGIITSVSKPFCSSCGRARVTADASLLTCLFASSGVSLRDALATADPAIVAEALQASWRLRRDNYSEQRAGSSQSTAQRVEMSYVGG